MKAKLSLLYLLLLLPCTFYAQSNNHSGTEFIFSYMRSGTFFSPASSVNHSIQLYSETDATAIVSIMNSSVWADTVQIPAFQVVNVNIPTLAANVFYTEGSNITNPKGALRITSDFPITVTALSQSNVSTDASAISPLSSLGTNTQYRVMANYPSLISDGYSSFIIVASHDNTMITINPSVDIADRPNIATTGTLAHTANVPYTITLNKGETYQAQSLSGTNNASGDLTGTLVESVNDCHPFMLFGGTTYSNIPSGSQDHLYNQITPNHELGQEYLLAPFYEAVNYQYRVLATEDNTTVNISGVTGAITLNAGQYFTGDANNETRRITADKNIAVAQFMKSGNFNGASTNIGDPSMVMINPQNQTVNTFSYIPLDMNALPTTPTTHALTIIVPSTGTNTVYLDNVLLPTSDFQIFSALPTYSYAIKEVSVGGHNISSSEGIVVYAYGLKIQESYAFSSGFSAQNTLADFTISDMRVNIGTAIDFSGTGMGVTNYAWDLGDGNTATGQTQTHLYNTPGIYEVCMAYTHPNNVCGDSICKFVEVVDVNSFLANTSYICDTDILLDPYPGNDAHITSYQWSKDGVMIPAPEGTADTLRVKDTELGTYTVSMTTSTGLMIQDETVVEIAPATDIATILGNDKICIANNEETTLSVSGTWEAYEWTISGDTTVVSTNLTITVDSVQTYVVEVTNIYGCSTTDSIEVIDDCTATSLVDELASKITIPNLITPNGDGQDDYFSIPDLAKLSCELEVKVFDLRGSVLFETRDAYFQWHPATTGLFVCVVFCDGVPIKSAKLGVF